jgi:hypothetical protein
VGKYAGKIVAEMPTKAWFGVAGKNEVFKQLSTSTTEEEKQSWSPPPSDL